MFTPLRSLLAIVLAALALVALVVTHHSPSADAPTFAVGTYDTLDGALPARSIDHETLEQSCELSHWRVGRELNGEVNVMITTCKSFNIGAFDPPMGDDARIFMLDNAGPGELTIHKHPTANGGTFTDVRLSAGAECVVRWTGTAWQYIAVDRVFDGVSYGTFDASAAVIEQPSK